MEIDSCSWEMNQDDENNNSTPTEPDSNITTTTTTTTITTVNKSKSSTTAKPSKSETKQKVPFTLKYQLNIRKTNNNNNHLISNDSPPPINVHNRLLQVDQDKGQISWVPEGYHQKRRMTNCNSSKPYDIKVPRPPNAFIIYHRNKSKELAKFKSIGKIESNERHPSKTVAEMWKEEPEAIKLRYQREADLALVEHKKKYPFYKYKPKKKDSKNKTRSQNSSKEMIKDLNNNHKNNENEIMNDEVPMQHRKQAAMESAFTAFDMQCSSSSSQEEENSADNISVSNHSPPHTPPPHTPTSPNAVNMPRSRAPASLWIEPTTDKPFFNEHLNFSPSQQRCQCTAHCVNNNNNNNHDVMTSLGIISPEQAAFSIIFSNVYKQTVDQLVNYGLMPISPHPITATIADDLVTSPYPTTSACSLDENTFFPPNSAHVPDWTYAADYVVPSQSPTSSSSSHVVTSPTSTDYMPWITYDNSQFIDPIQNITNIPNIVPDETNCNLFTDTNNDDCALFDNFDTNLNFSL